MISVAPPPTAERTQPRSEPLARTRLLVVEEHPAVRAGLRGLLDDEPDFEVIAAVATAEAGIEIAQRKLIDVAVIDYQLGGGTGLWWSRRLKRLPEPPAVLIYSAYTDGILAAAAVAAEADAIVSKGKLGRDLCRAIRSVASGHRDLPRLPPRLADSLRPRLHHAGAAVLRLGPPGVGAAGGGAPPFSSSGGGSGVAAVGAAQAARSPARRVADMPSLADGSAGKSTPGV